jgi:hypothetical protein
VDGKRWPAFAFIEALSPCVMLPSERSGCKKMMLRRE